MTRRDASFRCQPCWTMLASVSFWNHGARFPQFWIFHVCKTFTIWTILLTSSANLEWSLDPLTHGYSRLCVMTLGKYLPWWLFLSKKHALARLSLSKQTQIFRRWSLWYVRSYLCGTIHVVLVQGSRLLFVVDDLFNYWYFEVYTLLSQNTKLLGIFPKMSIFARAKIPIRPN